MDLTLEQQIGQMLWFGWQGETPEAALTLSPHARVLLEEFSVGGVILMGRNVRDPRQVAELTNALQAGSTIPLLIGTDQEGGSVVRMPWPGLTFPGNMALGAIDDPTATAAVASALGQQLAAMGLNVNFAPVLDVNNNPRNPVIGVRSFGEDPVRVAELGVAALRGYQAAQVISCVKHFPGHGDTEVDSHLDLPVQTAARSRLDTVELVPFRAAVAAGTPLLMTAHIRFTALDEQWPATLSPAVLTELLREEMGFEGVVVTDCLEMHGIAHHFGVEEAALAAVQAGADCLLACHTLETQRRIQRALLLAAQEGRLASDRIAASAERILRLKAAYRLSDRQAVDPSAAAATVSAPSFLELEQDIARRAVTVIRDEQNWLPIAERPVVVTGARSLVPEIVAALHQVGCPAAAAAPEELEVERNDMVLMVVLPGEPSPDSAPDIAHRCLSLGARVLVVAAREPYPLAAYNKMPCLLATYGHRGGCLPAFAEILVGRRRAEGRLPVMLV